MTEELKAKANAAYSKKEWREAVKLFADAAEQEQDGPAKATLLAKRSAAQVKLEDYSAGARLSAEQVGIVAD